MGTKKIAYEITVGVPQSDVNQIVSYVQEYLENEYDLKIKGLKDNAQLQELIKAGIKKSLQWTIDGMYGDEIVESSNIEKLFKKEIKEAEDKYEAKRLAEEEAERVKRIKTAGVLRMHPDQLAAAKKLLKEAGIEATV